ncbi:hypothetical protein CYMTET_23758 [Cymbomonas tetramitiformis]|uniref:Uncharacterized protein n=1 Tax=Cymbomonas tetramitiformis TaxID=36881 RepID=A0AAE0FX49_9CHLO|nr:hypothetical protein CYMTET_23758 [Cymbomonas tetramitiformis]
MYFRSPATGAISKAPERIFRLLTTAFSPAWRASYDPKHDAAYRNLMAWEVSKKDMFADHLHECVTAQECVAEEEYASDDSGDNEQNDAMDVQCT